MVIGSQLTLPQLTNNFPQLIIMGVIVNGILDEVCLWLLPLVNTTYDKS